MKRDTVVLVNVVMALVLVGVLMVYSAGTVRGYQANSDTVGHTFRYLWGQVLRVGIGLTLLCLAARFDYHNYRKRKVLWGIGLATIILLVLVLIIGEEVNGARRWIRIRKEMSEAVHVGVRPLTVSDWHALFAQHGLTVRVTECTPFHLLEPRRLVQDEGLGGALRFAWNAACDGPARARALAMRRVFRRHQAHLAAVMLVAEKRD